MIIRAFRREDEAGIRAICVGNARLPEDSRPDDGLFADYWTRYYTRHEPGHVWVAEKNGVVVGYLLAAFDTARFRRTMKFRILPALFFRLTLIGTMRHPASRLFLLKRIALWANPDPDPVNLLKDYPAHLHINLSEDSRNSGIGTGLLGSFLAEAKKSGMRGVHLETSESNTGARRFFERMGFSEIGRHFPFRKIDPDLADRAILIYGLRLV